MYFSQKFDFRESTFYLDENDEKVKLAKIEFLSKNALREFFLPFFDKKAYFRHKLTLKSSRKLNLF